MAEVRNKPGEVVSMSTDQLDSDGLRICRVQIDWFGFDNYTANIMNSGLIESVNSLVKGFNEVKNKGGGSKR